MVQHMKDLILWIYSRSGVECYGNIDSKTISKRTETTLTETFERVFVFFLRDYPQR